MKALVIVEHDGKQIKPATLNVLAAAQQLTNSIDVMLIGYQLQDVIMQAQSLPGITSIWLADDIAYQHLLAENVSLLLANYAPQYDYVLMSASTFGKDLLPRVAGILGVEQVSDITQIISPDTFIRPIYAGNAYAKVQLQEKIKLLTLRASAFVPVVLNAKQGIPVQTCAPVFSAKATTFVSNDLTVNERPLLTSARVIIAGGRGLQNGENFKLLESLASKLNAAIGATRAAVDAGFVPNDYQVGQTGKIVAPDLYIAVGISGAVQHLAGMKESKVIVAINKDPDAPIFAIADYGLVGDLFEIVPALEQALGPTK